MAYEVILLEETKAELIDAANFYNDVSEELSKDLVFKFFQSVDEIVKTPFRNAVLRKNYRKINLRRFPYKIIYRVENNVIYVVAFAHHKRKPFYWRGR